MAYPTPTELATMDYASLGEPAVDVPATSAVITATMDYAYLGGPFVVGDYAAGVGSVTCPIMISGWGWSMGGF